MHAVRVADRLRLYSWLGPVVCLSVTCRSIGHTLVSGSVGGWPHTTPSAHMHDAGEEGQTETCSVLVDVDDDSARHPPGQDALGVPGHLSDLVVCSRVVVVLA